MHECLSFLPQCLGVLCISLSSLRWGLGEDDAEERGGAWDVLDFAMASGSTSDISSRTESLPQRAHQRCSGQELERPSVRRGSRRSEKGKAKGKAENTSRAEATQHSPERCHRTARSEPLRHAVQATGPSQQRLKAARRGPHYCHSKISPSLLIPLATSGFFFFLFYESAREFGVTDGKSKRYKLTDTREIPKSLLSERVYVILSLWGGEIQVPFFKAYKDSIMLSK